MKLFRPAIALVLAVSLVGCVSQSQIAALTQILGTSAASIASIQGNADLASKLTVDTAAAVKAVNEWKSGTNAQEAILALNLVRDDLYLFPQVQPYSALIILAIGTTESILQLLPQQPAMLQGNTTHVLASSEDHAPVALPVAPKTAKDFKNQWNAIVAQHPELAPVKIK